MNHLKPPPEKFRKFANAVSVSTGSSYTFGIAVIIIVIWAFLGPLFDYSDTWQLVINTGTTIVTFLMVFLIQNTQNRDARAIHLKLDELIRANAHARNRLIDLESLSDVELDRLHDEFYRFNQENEERMAKIRETRKAKRHHHANSGHR